MMREIVSCPSSSVLGLKGAPLAVAFILLSFGLSLVSKRPFPSGKMPLLFTYDSFGLQTVCLACTELVQDQLEKCIEIYTS